jgi:hypothetical protein
MDRREKARAALTRARKQLENAKSKREATIKLLIRLDTKTIPALEQTVRRIGKRIDRIDEEAFKPQPVAAKESPPIPPVSANKTDGNVPTRPRRTPKQAPTVVVDQDAVVQRPKRKHRRTPDDFRTEMMDRKGGSGEAAGETASPVRKS